MNSTIGIKIVDKNINANIITIIRKYYNNEKSIQEIKQLIESNNYIAFCDYIDKDGIEKVLQLYEQLKKENIECKLFEHDNQTTIEFLNNLLMSYLETERQIEEEIDYESEEY